MLPITEMRLPGLRDDLPTLVLLHMFGLSRREWIEAGLALAPQFRVVTIDTPGFGEAADTPGWSVEQMAEQFAQVTTQLGLKRWVLVGHSMTGKVAAVLAGSRPPGLEKLVLVTPSPLSPEPIAPEARASMLAQTEPTRADAERFLNENSALPIPPDVFERTMEDRLRANPQAWRAWLEQGSNEDWSRRIGTLGIPALVIAGEKDGSLGPEAARGLVLPHLANARFEVIPGSGHMIPLEAPERLTMLIREFAAG